MKKLLFILAAVLNCAFAVSSQTAQVATLSHEGAITTFYSANALKDAYNAAVEGDVITLSAGTFSSPAKIEKNITVRGAGMMPDATPTILNGDIDIQTPDSETAYFTLEGVYHNGKTEFRGSKDVKLIKCYFRILRFYGNLGANKNMMIINCMALQCDYGTNTDATFINDILNKLSLNLNSGSFTNCVLKGNDVLSCYHSSLNNCVIIYTGNNSNMTLPDSSTAAHCYCIGNATNPFKYSPSTTNVVNNSLTAEDVFKDLVTYELKDEYTGSWLGEDGTQVGAYGGFLPFDPTPTNPQISKFNVSSKTTADGMLSVDIEVKANN